MYIFLFAHYMGGGAGHEFKQIIAPDLSMVYRVYPELDRSFWKVETVLPLIGQAEKGAILIWEFRYDDPNYEG